MKRLHQEKEYQKNKHFSFLLIVLFIILISLVITQVFLANQLAETGEKIKSLSLKKDSLDRENEKLMEVVTRETSFDEISEKAKKLGLVKLTSIVYLSAPLTTNLYEGLAL